MEIKLNFQNFKNVKVDEDIIKWKIEKIFAVINKPRTNTSIYENEQRNSKNAQKIVLFLKDLGINIGEKEIQNIIKKNIFENEKEWFVRNLKEGITMFVDSNKIIHQNNISLLYQIITNNDRLNKNENIYRKENNHNPYIEVYALPQTIDCGQIHSMMDQLIHFINQPFANEVETFANMQIILLQMLLISPFNKHNFLLSKMISVWYWRRNNPLNTTIPLSDYLESLAANEQELQRRIQTSLKIGDYTNFIGYVADEFLKILTSKMLMKEISSYLISKKKHLLANHEKSFLFNILHFKLYEFDWKMFKNTTKWKFSKQYIMNVLTGLEKKYDLLSSQKIKNRKFFKKSRFLIYLINLFETPNQLQS